MNSASINQGVFAPSPGAELVFPGSNQSQSENDFQALFKAHMLGNNSTEAKVEARTMAFGMRRGEASLFTESAKFESRPSSFSDQFKKADQLSKRTDTDRTHTKTQATKASAEKSADYKSRAEAEDKTARIEQSDTGSEKVTESDVNCHEDVQAVEGLMKEDLATQDRVKLAESLAKLEEKIEELKEAGELKQEVAAKLSELVAELQKISESADVDEKTSEKLVELANNLLAQLEEPDSRAALSMLVQQSNSMIEGANADSLKKVLELQKVFASAEKGTDSKLAQGGDITEENIDETPVENADENHNKLSVEQRCETESKKKPDSESKHQQSNDESKTTQRVVRQDKAIESVQPSLRQKQEMLDGNAEISQEISSAEEASVSGTTETTVDQTTLSAVKTEVAAQAAVKQSVEQKPDINQAKDSLATKKAETSITGNTGAEPGNQRSDNGSQNSQGQGLASGGNYNSSGLASAKNATPQTNPAQFAELLEKAELLKTNNGKQILSLEMTPDELGKLEMELTSRDGVLTARISAENTLARAKLEEMASQIKENLLEQGINLSEITVDISSKNPDEQKRSAMFNRKNKSKHGSISHVSNGEEVIRKNILPNLRRSALNIKAVDLTV